MHERRKALMCLGFRAKKQSLAKGIAEDDYFLLGLVVHIQLFV